MREIEDEGNKKIPLSQLQHPDGYTCSTALSPTKIHVAKFCRGLRIRYFPRTVGTIKKSLSCTLTRRHTLNHIKVYVVQDLNRYLDPRCALWARIGVAVRMFWLIKIFPNLLPFCCLFNNISIAEIFAEPTMKLFVCQMPSNCIHIVF